MKIYIVQVLNDLSSSYNGLRDTEITMFANLDEAKEALKKAYETSIEDFGGVEALEEYDYDDEENIFTMNNSCSYVSGTILEQELEIKKYIKIHDGCGQEVLMPVKNTQDCIEIIIKEYRKYDCSMVDIIDDVELIGFTIEESITIAAECHRLADSDYIVRVVNATPQDLLNDEYDIIEY